MKTGTEVQTPLLAAKFCVCAAACSFCWSSKTVLVVLIYRMFGRPVRGEQSSKKGREVSNVLCTLPMRARPNATRTCTEAVRTEIAPARAQQCLPPAGCAPTKEGPLAACGQREVEKKGGTVAPFAGGCYAVRDVVLRTKPRLPAPSRESLQVRT